MTCHTIMLAGAVLSALPSGALWWPDARLLCVSDLHIGKATRAARFGGTMLPPYETEDTLARLGADLDATRPARVICLGDSFDHGDAAEDLAEAHRLRLAEMMAGRDWTWISGNHDPVPMGMGGRDRAQVTLGPLTFRHIADRGARGEVSGHYHPKARLGGQARPCFLACEDRLILPAYGTYTGGLACEDRAFDALMGPRAIAILTGRRTFAVPRGVRRAQ